MAVDFTKPDKFDASKGYKRVLFGEDGGITESELAEVQKIQDQRLRDSFEALIGRVTALLSGTISYNGSTLTATSLVGYIDGELFQYSGSIALVNNDKVYLEVIESTIAYQQDPNILDSRMGEETSRRIKNTYALKKTNTGTGTYFELGQVLSGNFVETASRITPYADLGTDDINVIATKPASASMSAYPYGVTIFKYLTGDAGYPVTNSTIMTFNNAQGADGFQILYGYVSNKPVQYVRYFTGSAWGAWEKFATTADLTAHANDAVAHITGAERALWNASQLKKLTESNGYSISSDSADMNTLRTTGFYYGSQMTNGPAGMTTGWVLVHAVNANYCVQEFTINSNTQSSTRRFWRVYFNGTWVAWNEYASSDIATQTVKGLMSASDKTKLDNGQNFRLTQDSGANKNFATTTDLSTLTNTSDAGIYITGSNTLGLPLKLPEYEKAGTVQIIARDNNSIQQIYISYTGRIFHRYVLGSGGYRLSQSDSEGWVEFVQNYQLFNAIMGNNMTDVSVTNLKGKTKGDVATNPHIVRWELNPALTNPNFYQEIAQADYDKISSNDGQSYTVVSTANGNLAQTKFSFNVLDFVQRSYGNIPGATVTEKVTWLKQNISKIVFNWTGMGKSATGNKAIVAWWAQADSAYYSFFSHTEATAQNLSITLNLAVSAPSRNVIDSNGFAHFVAYAEASNGTLPTSITTDYVKLDVEISPRILDGLLDATSSSRGIMSATDKAKLDGIANNANNYVHPSTHAPSIIVQDANNRFVTDTEKATWNGKASTAVATTSANGLMSSSDKSKLDGIQAGAEVNQNSFSNILVGGVTVQADSKQDTVAFIAGPNIVLSGDATNDTVTIGLTGTVPNSASTPWTGITGKPTKVEDFGITDVTLRYGATIQGQVWSRILEMSNASVFGHQFLITIKGTRNAVVYKATLLVTTGHSQTAQIVQLNNINYSDLQVRAVVDTNGNGWLEINDNVNGIVSGTAQAVSVELIQIQDTNLVPLKTFTTGAVIPSTHAERGLMTTVKNKAFVGDLVGNVTGNVTGNSDTATKLATARNISLSGDATGSTSFDGTGNVSINVVVQDDSHNHVIGNVDGLQTALNDKDSISSVNSKVAQARTDLEAYVEGNTKIAFKDTRDVNSPPSFYTAGEGRKTHFEFKDKSVIGLSNASGAWISLITHARWSESSGGNPSQTAIDDIGEMYMRVRINDTTWSPWRKFAFDEVVTTSSNGLMSASDKTKLNGIANNANNYVHPSTHAPSIITQDANNRFVTDAEKAYWSGKGDAPQVKTFNTPATAGWYRIAVSDVNINKDTGRFEIDWSTAGSHGQVNFNAGIMFGVDPTINQTMYSNYNSSTGIKRARIVYHASYNGNYAYLEIYNETALALTVTIQLYSALGWNLITPIAGSVPSGYTNMELSFADGIVTDSQLVSRASTGTAPLQVSSTTVVPNLNADMVDGAHPGTGANNILKLDGSGKASAGIIAQDSNNRFTTDAEKANWNGKETTGGAQAKATTAYNDAIGFVTGYGLGGEATAFPTTDWNNHTAKTGFYNGANMANSPGGSTGWHYVIHVRHANNTGYVTQMAFPFDQPGKMFFRACNAGTWQAWTQNAVFDSSAKVPLGNLPLDSSNRFVTDAEKATWNGKASTAVATTSANGLMSSGDKSKLDGIASGATNTVNNATNGSITINGVAQTVYTHPSSHPASIITQDANNRFVTDAEKSMWTGKETTSGAQARATQALNDAKTFVRGFGLGDSPSGFTGDTTNLDNMTTSGFYRIGSSTTNGPSGSAYGQLLVVRGGSDTVAQIVFPYNDNKMYFRAGNPPSAGGGGGWTSWSTISDSLATTSLKGLMSPGDKSKLDGIANNANNYVHPSSHPASIITQDSNNRFVSDSEKQTWNNKASTAIVTTSYDGLMSSADKVKLDGAQFYKLMDDNGKRFFYANLNFATFEGLFYAETGASNTPDSSHGWFVNVMRKEQFIYQIAIGNTLYSKYMTRRSSDSGSTWEAWSEFGTSNLDWKTATLQSGHSALSGRAVKYAKDGNLLYIRGAISKDGPGTIGGDGNPIFTLPAGFRPKTVCYNVPAMLGTGSTSNYMNRLEVQTSGMVNLAFNWNAQYYGLDMIVPLD